MTDKTDMIKPAQRDDSARVVYLASPFTGRNDRERARNREYLIEALAHSVAKGEAPIVPHLVLPYVLDDDIQQDRSLALELGMELLKKCDLLVAYCDLGTSWGMAGEIAAAREHGLSVEVRLLGRDWQLENMVDGPGSQDQGASDG